MNVTKLFIVFFVLFFIGNAFAVVFDDFEEGSFDGSIWASDDYIDNLLFEETIVYDGTYSIRLSTFEMEPGMWSGLQLDSNNSVLYNDSNIDTNYEVWFYVDSTNGGYPQIILKTDGGGYIMGIEGDATGLGAYSESDINYFGTSYNIDEWNKIVFVSNNSDYFYSVYLYDSSLSLISSLVDINKFVEGKYSFVSNMSIGSMVEDGGSEEYVHYDYIQYFEDSALRFNFYDDTTETGLDQVYLEFDGTPYYSDTNTYVDINLQGITSGSKNIIMQKTSYPEKNFNLTLNEYSDLNYNIGFILSSKVSIVEFQVFTETGALKPNTTFMCYDNDNNYLIDIKTTSSVGKMTLNLNNQKSDYNFISTDLNFNTTTWTINKPKDATTLLDITGNWKYSITGNSYSSGTEIASGITKLLLQNTVNPYYIKIQDVNENYAESQFGLKSITSEKTKTLNSYLYPFGSANPVLIKLLDFATNQPISTFNELTLSLYTDSNGLIEIGTYINDSTGTYNIYMDSNEKYDLFINDQTFILNPTLSIYYLYLTETINLYDSEDVNTITNPFVDLNSPAIMGQVKEYFFGCSAEEENCVNSIIFSLIFIVILAIGFSVYLTIGSLEQSILIVVLMGVFTFIGFIPLWLFAITTVIAFMWGVFG